MLVACRPAGLFALEAHYASLIAFAQCGPTRSAIASLLTEGQLTPPKSRVEVGPRKQKIGMWRQATARDIPYGISGRPSMTQGPGTSHDARKLALLERS
jgi:hypothetical protein